MGEQMAVSEHGQQLPAVPAHRKGPWAASEVSVLIRMWGEGASNAQIAQKLNRNENAVAIKASRLGMPAKSQAVEKMRSADAKNTKKGKLRPCLSCQTTFFSEGVGNRICDGCKSTSSWSSGDYVVMGGR